MICNGNKPVGQYARETLPMTSMTRRDMATAAAARTTAVAASRTHARSVWIFPRVLCQGCGQSQGLNESVTVSAGMYARAQRVNLYTRHVEGTFMRAIIGAILTVIGALIIAACSTNSGSTAPANPPSSSSTALPSSSVPLRTDAAACREFRSWYRQFGPQDRLDNTGKMVVLLIGISEAPPDQLHQDLSVLGADVIKGSKATGSLRRVREQMTVNAAHTVAQHCQAVNASP